MPTLQVKRRNTGGGAPASLQSGELAYDVVNDVFYIGRGDNGSGVATSIKSIGGAGAFLLASLLGVASGIATLDTGGKIPVGQLPASVVGGLNYQGGWNASTNSPALASGVGTKGFYYKVSTAGTTAIDGNSNWSAGDYIAFNGTAWDAIDGTLSEVLSVAGRTGAITLVTTDISDSGAIGRNVVKAANTKAARLAVGVDQLATVNDANKAQATGEYKILYSALTAARAVTLLAANAFSPGTEVQIGDQSGACSATNTLTISAAGSDTINGAASATISSAYGQIILVSDGVSKWSILVQPTAAPTTVDGGTY